MNTIALENLGLKGETLPFDWVPSCLKIINECIKNDFEGFTQFGTPIIKENFNDCLVGVSEYFNFRISSYFNQYNIWFPHDYNMNIPTHIIKDRMERRIKRFMDILNGQEDITFIYNNTYFNIDKYYEDQKKVYNDLLEFESLIISKFNRKNFKIIAFFINSAEFTHNTTDHIECYNIEWTENKSIDDNNILTDTLSLAINKLDNLVIYKTNNSPLSTDLLSMFNCYFQVYDKTLDDIDYENVKNSLPSGSKILITKGGVRPIHKKIISFKYYKNKDIIGHDTISVTSPKSQLFNHMLKESNKAFNTKGYIKNFIGAIESNWFVGDGGIVVKTRDVSNIYIHHSACELAINKNFEHFNIIY